MKTSAPVHVDRLAQALKAQGIDIKRSKVIELAAAAFGFHNSNEFQAAARSGDLSPPLAVPLGEVSMANGTRLTVLQDARDLPYAVVRSSLGKGRESSIGITPYGGLVTLPTDGDALSDETTPHETSVEPSNTIHLAVVEYDVDQIVGAGRIKVIIGATAAERERALAEFCRDRWDHAHATTGMITGHLPLEPDGLDEEQIIETYFAATTDVLLDRETVASGKSVSSTTSDVLPKGHVAIDVDTLSALVEAADAHADTLADDLEDDNMSSDDAESTQEALDQVNDSITKARSLYGTAGLLPSSVTPGVSIVYDPSRFTLVSNEALKRVVGAAESHLEDAETGVDEGLYDPKDNLWTDDLQKAIDAIRATRSADTIEPRETRTGIVHVAVMRTEHSDEVKFSCDPRYLDRLIADHCRSNWGSLTSASGGGLDPALLPDAQVIETFYAAHAATDEPAYALERREEQIDLRVGSELEAYTVNWSRHQFHPNTDPMALAARLESGIAADIWDTDAVARKDEEAVTEMADAKAAMELAARMLRESAQARLAQTGNPIGSSPPNSDEPIWLTDVEGDTIFDITRDQLEALGLPYGRGDDSNDWLPLTDEEYAYLQPGASMASNPWSGKIVGVPNDDEEDGVEVRLGQSCVWKGQKWQVPSIEFAFGEGERDQAFSRLQAYVDNLKPLVSRLDGDIRVHPDATDYAHGVDIFLPMSLALDFEGTEDWAKAIAWLLCPADLRHHLVTVTASFETPTVSPGFNTGWDATFDVLREGRERALSYLLGDKDDQMTMRIAESSLAHKDAWSLWNEDWDMKLDMDALKRLYSIR